MTKQIQISKRPEQKRTADEWVNNHTKSKLKKICIGIPVEMHRRIKVDCAERGITMQGIICEAVMKKYGENNE